jgi:hypothetical protein
MKTGDSGWIILPRDIQETEEWFSEPFTRSQAWIDLVLLANHNTRYIRKRGILIAVDRGGVGYSEETLAARWKWSRGKVRRFFAELTRENRVERRISEETVQKHSSVSSCIYIINYDKYQLNGTEDGTEDGQKTVQEQITTNNEKNKKGTGKRKKTPLTDEQYLEYLQFNSAYSYLDVAKERDKCEAWHRGQGNELTRKKLLNWLNRADKPMQTQTRRNDNGTGTEYPIDIEA